MARKDWKKEPQGKDEDVIQWFNENTQESVFVYEQTFIEKLNKKSFWVFEVGTSKKTILETKARSKQDAISKANSYMRTH